MLPQSHFAHRQPFIVVRDFFRANFGKLRHPVYDRSIIVRYPNTSFVVQAPVDRTLTGVSPEAVYAAVCPGVGYKRLALIVTSRHAVYSNGAQRCICT